MTLNLKRTAFALMCLTNGHLFASNTPMELDEEKTPTSGSTTTTTTTSTTSTGSTFEALDPLRNSSTLFGPSQASSDSEKEEKKEKVSSSYPTTRRILFRADDEDEETFQAKQEEIKRKRQKGNLIDELIYFPEALDAVFTPWNGAQNIQLSEPTQEQRAFYNRYSLQELQAFNARNQRILNNLARGNHRRKD